MYFKNKSIFTFPLKYVIIKNETIFYQIYVEVKTMLRKLRDTLLLVALSIFMLLGSSTVSRAEETSHLVPGTNEIIGGSDATTTDVAEPNQELLASAEACDERIAIRAKYDECKNSLLSENATLADKYADLLTICYCQTSFLYFNEEISYETYELQRTPFMVQIESLETASDEEILDGYSSLLIYLYDIMEEDLAADYEIDQELYDFVLNEIEENDIEL